MAEPFLRLREPTSHGFRPSFQAAEVHGGFRYLLSERAEWRLPWVLAKVDIAKTDDSLSWSAIQRTLERRKLPLGLQSAYWRCHRGRTSFFATSDRKVVFTAVPTRGMPKGSPESPLAYAAVMEDSQHTRARRASACRRTPQRPRSWPAPTRDAPFASATQPS